MGRRRGGREMDRGKLAVLAVEKAHVEAAEGWPSRMTRRQSRAEHADRLIGMREMGPQCCEVADRLLIGIGGCKDEKD